MKTNQQPFNFDVDFDFRHFTNATNSLTKTFTDLNAKAQADYLRTTFNRLCIAVTMRCDRSCKMCAFGCGPHVTDPPITPEIVDKFLQGIKDLNVRVGGNVYLTGGEPTTEPDIISVIVEIIKSYGHRCVLVTNGQFARSFESATAFLSRLKDKGLNEVDFSWDEDHQKANSIPNRVATGLAAAHSLNFDAMQLNSVTAFDNTPAFHRILDFVRDKYNIKLNYDERLDPQPRPGGIHFDNTVTLSKVFRELSANDGSPLLKVRSPGKIGHAGYTDPYTPRWPIHELTETGVNTPCLRAPLLYPNADLHMCCTPVMVGGNINEESVPEIYARYENNKVYKLLRDGHGDGLIRYAQFIDAFTGSNLFNRQWSCLCDLCLYLHQVHLPTVIRNNQGLKCVREYVPFHDVEFAKVKLNVPPQNAKLIESIKKNVDGIWDINTYRTCKYNIQESWEPLVKDHKISAALKNLQASR